MWGEGKDGVNTDMKRKHFNERNDQRPERNQKLTKKLKTFDFNCKFKASYSDVGFL